MTSDSVPVWTLAGGRSITLDRPRIMAIINATPDSFHAASRAAGTDAVVESARLAVEAGADVLDIGGESTRPGASRVEAAEQIRRVVPAIAAIREQPGPLGAVPISVDTTRSEVAGAALDAGADAVNDVSGGAEDPALVPLAAERGAGLVLMHRLRSPEADSFSDRYASPPAYDDVVRAVAEYLAAAAASAHCAGSERSSIVLDPGLGFGKGLDDTLRLIRATPDLAGLGYPVLSALSRKSFVGRFSLGRDSEPGERLAGTLAMSTTHLMFGARLFRVHDVAAHREALSAAWAVWASRPPGPI